VPLPSPTFCWWLRSSLAATCQSFAGPSRPCTLVLDVSFHAACASSSNLIIPAVISATELVGKLTVNQGIVSSFRPRKYLTIPRQSLENVLGDVEQLINFFVIEFQRIMLAENLGKTVAVSCVTPVEEFGCSLPLGLYCRLGFLLSHHVPPTLGSPAHWSHHHVLRAFDIHQQQGTHR